MIQAGTPTAGDIIVRIGDRDSQPAHLLRAFPGPEQLAFATLAETARLARGYAKYAAVNVWLEEESGELKLLARFRQTVFERAKSPRKPAWDPAANSQLAK